MTVTTKRSLIALLLSLVLVVSLFTVGFSAASEAGATDPVESSSDSVEGSEGESTPADSETGSETGSSTATDSETETETAEETDTPVVGGYTDEQKAALKKILIINGVIIGAIVLIAVILVIKFRTRLANFFRSAKSERKKIVWCSKEQTKKNFLVVMIVAIAFAVGLFLADIAFTQGLGAIANIFRK